MQKTVGKHEVFFLKKYFFYIAKDLFYGCTISCELERFFIIIIIIMIIIINLRLYAYPEKIPMGAHILSCTFPMFFFVDQLQIFHHYKLKF